MEFNEFIFYGFIVKGEFNQALSYLKQFDKQYERQAKYHLRFEQEQYQTYDIAAPLNRILQQYQRYYREVFFLEQPEYQAYERLKQQLLLTLNVVHSVQDIEQLENLYIAPLFRKHGFHFLGGRTSGYFGPYIWQKEEQKIYEVTLPEGVQTYKVKLLSDFVMNGWIDYLSFGEIGTGGWIDKEGVICCVKHTYDLESENFTVSLLKHEAQHVVDLARYPEITSEELEYRAKLVELMYTKERNLLKVFIHQARNSDVYNGHSLAAHRIVTNFEQMTNKALQDLSTADIQQMAGDLFNASQLMMAEKDKDTR